MYCEIQDLLDCMLVYVTYSTCSSRSLVPQLSGVPAYQRQYLHSTWLFPSCPCVDGFPPCVITCIKLAAVLHVTTLPYLCIRQAGELLLPSQWPSSRTVHKESDGDAQVLPSATRVGWITIDCLTCLGLWRRWVTQIQKPSLYATVIIPQT